MGDKARELWGEDGAKSFSDAMKACHDFAQKSACPLGYDVIRWMADQNEALHHSIKRTRLLR